MDINAMKSLAIEIEKTMPWLTGIKSDEQYNDLINLTGTLVEDYDSNKTLVDLLFPVIENYEATAPRFEAFNKEMDAINTRVSVLKALIASHGLTLSDFKEEIGDKSSVSMILNGHSSLTLKHINALSKRFNIPAEMFD